MTIENSRKFPWKFLGIILLMVIVIFLWVGGRNLAESNFYDCFSKNGVSNIYQSSQRDTFIRTCKMPDGKLLSQEVRLVGDEWEVTKYYLTDSWKEIPGAIHQIYPNPTNTFLVIIEELRSLIIK